MKLLPLQGINSFYAAQAVHKLILGLKMLPAYVGESYEAFLHRLDQLPAGDQETMIREAATFVKLETDEMLDLCQFAADPNGVPYGEPSLKNAKPELIHEIIVAVSMEVLKAHKIRLISEDEKKN